MLILSDNHSFAYCASPGTLGYDGRGWWWQRILALVGLFDTHQLMAITPTLTPRALKKNHWIWWRPWEAFRLLPDGIMDLRKPSNIGFWRFIQLYQNRLNTDVQEVCVSVGVPRISRILRKREQALEQIRAMARVLAQKDIVGIEFNYSMIPSPSKKMLFLYLGFVTDACRIINEESRKPVGIRLPCERFRECAMIVHRTEPWIQWISIDRPRVRTLQPEYQKLLPSQDADAFIACKEARRIAFEFFIRLKKRTSRQIISPDVWTGRNISAARKSGAAAIAFDTLLFRRPLVPTRIMREEKLGDLSKMDLSPDTLFALVESQRGEHRSSHQ